MAKKPIEAVRQPLSPPLAGGDKGEGEYEIPGSGWLYDKYIWHR
jgi:hypothetical protein